MPRRAGVQIPLDTVMGGLIKRCCKKTPTERPTATDVVAALEKLRQTREAHPEFEIIASEEALRDDLEKEEGDSWGLHAEMES